MNIEEIGWDQVLAIFLVVIMVGSGIAMGVAAL